MTSLIMTLFWAIPIVLFSLFAYKAGLEEGELKGFDEGLKRGVDETPQIRMKIIHDDWVLISFVVNELIWQMIAKKKRAINEAERDKLQEDIDKLMALHQRVTNNI